MAALAALSVMESVSVPLRNYFAFGANMSGAALTVRLGGLQLPGPKEGIPSVLQGYDLQFQSVGFWPLVEGSFATVVPRQGREVYGVIHRLSEAQLALLDELEGVQDGQNDRIDGVMARPLAEIKAVGHHSCFVRDATNHHSDDIASTLECTLYVPASSSSCVQRLKTQQTVNPSARYLELLEFASRKAGLPIAWSEGIAAKRLSLAPPPTLVLDDLRKSICPTTSLSFACLSHLESNMEKETRQLTSLCGIIFDCTSAHAALMPALVGKEVSLAALRRATKTWLDEQPPTSVAEARECWGEERVEAILGNWLAQFCDSFGKPVGMLHTSWEAAATSHHLPL
eukprot:TRINITY_DN36121_c0_g1_i1.p1 TRINITY_DN36121_c0_g1~~TRINITY_DN36121_c0_g1_i1.p1  ORF type:complete len:342 (+),score=53.67 TRINITY_DN36121_c0_g1_i1:118-1143(+)